LQNIENFKKTSLKKAVTNDRSKPILKKGASLFSQFVVTHNWIQNLQEEAAAWQAHSSQEACQSSNREELR
jgi:hypothetical protein